MSTPTPSSVPTPRRLPSLSPAAILTAAAALACCLEASPASGQDDWGSWHSVAVTEFETARVEASAFFQLRLHDANTEVRQVYVSQRLAVDAHRNLGLGANYTYLPTRSPTTGVFLDQHRIELEATPRVRASERLNLAFRNRLELRWLEDRPGVNERSRHRLQANIGRRNAAAIAFFFASDEVFYDWDGAGFNENRLTPVGLHIALRRSVAFDLYYMVQSEQIDARWNHTHLLGTHAALAW
jgi:hypothetical protein